MEPLVTRNFDAATLNNSPLASRRAQSSMSGRFPRSWHPSPFASDDDACSTDEPQFFKEEKKNRIKMEIARRRQQIEENACLHDELNRLARLRENVEITDRLNPVIAPTSQTGLLYGNSPGIYNPNNTMTSAAGTSVLKSVDEILRGDGHHLHHNDLSSYSHRTNHYPTTTASSSTSRYGRNFDTLYQDHNPNSTLVNHSVGGYPHHQTSDLYTGSSYDRVTDFSPIHPEPHLMGDMMNSRRHFDMDTFSNPTAVGGKYQKFASYK